MDASWLPYLEIMNVKRYQKSVYKLEKIRLTHSLPRIETRQRYRAISLNDDLKKISKIISDRNDLVPDFTER
jgi:hypothetical protein